MKSGQLDPALTPDTRKAVGIGGFKIQWGLPPGDRPCKPHDQRFIAKRVDVDLNAITGDNREFTQFKRVPTRIAPLPAGR